MIVFVSSTLGTSFEQIFIKTHKFHFRKCTGICRLQMAHSLPIYPSHRFILTRQTISDSKLHGANMGPTWVLSARDGPHVGPRNLAIRDYAHLVDFWQDSLSRPMSHTIPTAPIALHFEQDSKAWFPVYSLKQYYSIKRGEAKYIFMK